MTQNRTNKFPKDLADEIRKLKAIVTFVIYGLLLLLIKTLYETLVEIPDPSWATIIIILAFILVLIIFMINQFSKNIIKRITIYTSEIEEARKFSEDIFNTVQYPLLVIDGEFNLLQVNRSFMKTFQIKPHETEKTVFFDLVEKQWNIPILKNILEDMQQQQVNLNDFELEYNFPRIGYRIFLINTFHISTEGQRVFLVSMEDITQRKTNENRLKEQTLQLKNISKAKSDFLASMSHELRTPLNAIIGFSELMKDGLIGKLNENQIEYASDIFNNGKYLLSLITDILDIAKIEAGKMTLNLERTNIQMLFEHSLKSIRKEASQHKISMIMEIEENIEDIFLDPIKVKQIAYNLLSNAVKFTPDGGRIKLKAWQEKLPAPCFKFSVEDSGIGISEENLPRIFDPFQQIKTVYNQKQQGTGLGLSMVKRLAELHGGSIEVVSELNKGSRFIIVIPYQTDRSNGSDRQQGKGQR